MGRNNQRLINFHTSGLTSMPVASDVHYGEIVVRHNKQQPELLIKVSESEFGVIPGSGAVASAISVAAESLQNKIEAVDGRVNTVSGDLNTFKTTVANTYETKDNVSTAITAAKDSVYLSATTAAAADATTKANKAKEDAIAASNTSAVEITGKIDAVDDRVDTVSASLNTFKTDVAKTYETKDNVTTAITAAKDSVYLSATTAAATDAQSKADAAQTAAIKAAAASAKTLNSSIEAVDDRVDTVSGDLNTFKTTVADTYATKDNVSTAITAAKDSVYLSATTAAFAEAKSKADAAQTAAIKAAAASAKTLNSSIEAVDDRVDTVSGDLNTFKTDVADTYATKTGVTSDIKDAKDSVYSSATTAAATDATTKANKAKEDAIAAAAASANTLNNRIEAVDDKVDSLKTDLTDTINNKVATAYRYQKTVTNYADLPTSEMSKDTTGYVYNVEKANGNYPAGTNYAWNGTEWDALGGSVDLSPYALKTEVTGAKKTLQDNIDAANGRINTVSASLNTFKTTVADTYATKTSVTSDIATAKSEAISAAAADAKAKADSAQTAAIKAAAASAQTLSNRIEAVDDRVDTVSGNLNSFKTTVANTYETKDNVTTAITAAKNSVYSSATTAAAADAKSQANSAKTAAINAAAASAQTLSNRIEAVDDRVDTVSGDLNTFKTDVADTYATKTGVTSDIKDAKDSVYSSATTAAAADAQSKADGAKTAAINAAAASANTLQNNIDAVNNSVTGLSASTVSIKATADKAVQTASIVDSATCKVSVSKVNTELKFDFRNIVIDCGDF